MVVVWSTRFIDTSAVSTVAVARAAAISGAVGCALVVIAGIVIGAGVVIAGWAVKEGEDDAEDYGGWQAEDGSIEGQLEASGGEHHLLEGWGLSRLQHLMPNSDKIIWVSCRTLELSLNALQPDIFLDKSHIS